MSRLNLTVPSVEFTMSQTVAFTPQYPQPFTLQEAMNLELDSLIAGKSAGAMELRRVADGERRSEPADQLYPTPLLDTRRAAGIHTV